MVGAVLVGLFTLLLLGSLLWRSVYSPAEVAACGTGSGCPGLNAYETARTVYWSLLNQSQNVLLLVPLVIAAYAAGPLTARERELGTHHLLWTQSAASPARWLRSTLALGSVAVAVGAVFLVMVFRTAVAPMEGVWGFGGWEPGGYVGSGPVLVAYSLLGLAFGVCAGTLIGRALPAIFAGVAGTGVLLLAAGVARPWLWPASTLVAPFTRDRKAWPSPGDGAWDCGRCRPGAVARDRGRGADRSRVLLHRAGWDRGVRGARPGPKPGSWSSTPCRTGSPSSSSSPGSCCSWPSSRPGPPSSSCGAAHPDLTRRPGSLACGRAWAVFLLGPGLPVPVT